MAASEEGGGAEESAARQERLLSDVAHELGNYFHKLYYWAELVREQTGREGENEPGVLLERTVRELETFLKTTLELFRPIRIAPMTLSADEVARSTQTLLARHAGAEALRWRVEGAPLAGAVQLDPGRFSFVIDSMVRRLGAAPGESLAGTVHAEGGCLVVALGAPAGTRPPADVAAAVDWAVVERVVALHGGRLATTAAGEIRLTLPLQD